ncbi:membrane protein insertase, YidC/Oxa1 family [Alicyclobacillus acidocaldarius subsp. acidocaldarius Tc-4-1]|uniref:Membrane protein insertase, YidC/Oxa1 family n=1 Tax=Alicyclobacillus acidocaldarius (strain Tc-4-1) TaxID=1048834 RepID=F8IEE8_ALIAT|nr:membrane protein insertase, YidC/Oxa1 family [Alicyclobacillus acidocaldarius subsp. acidocaldarius Tc-4-1]
MALTGCGLYPTKPGEWPNNVWGSILHGISDLMDYFAHLFGNDYGISILFMAILVRLVVLPLFLRQIHFQRAMVKLQPEIQKIRTKYKFDNQKMQEELMKLYQEAGMNPLAGCFPMLIQLPFLWAFYGAIVGNVGMRHSTFLGIFPLGHWDTHYVLPVLAALSTLLSSWLSMRSQPVQQKSMLFVYPVMIFFFAFRLPGGLVLYWIYTNLLVALQVYLFITLPNMREQREMALAGGGKSARRTTADVPAKQVSASGTKASNSSKAAANKVSSRKQESRAPGQKSSKKSSGAKKTTDGSRADGSSDGAEASREGPSPELDGPQEP